MWVYYSHLRRARNIYMTAWKNNFFSFHSLSSPKKFLVRRTCNFPILLSSKIQHVKFVVRFSSNTKRILATTEIKRLLTAAKTEKWKLAGAVLLLFLSSAVTMSVPFCVGKIIDIMTSSSDDMKSNLITICKVLVAIFIIGATANFGRVYLINISSQNVINELRKKIYASVLSQESAFFDCNKTGELVNRLSVDTATVGMSITNNVSDGLRSSFSFLASSSLMIYTSPELATVGLVTVAPVALIAVIFGKYLKKNSQHVQDALASATQVAEERISNIRTVQAFLRLQHENKLYNAKIDSVLYFAKNESLLRAAFFGLTGFSGNLIILSVLYYGGQMMSENIITIGGLSSFLLYAAYVGISIGGMSNFYTEFMRGLGASSRLWELIDRKPLISAEGGITLASLQGNVHFSNVTFAYPSRPDVFVLSDFSLSIPAGSVCAIVGSSGCGKSTVGSLLLRLYDTQKGTIFIDEVDIKSMNLLWLRKSISIVSQEPVLFSFSIRENVMYGLPDDVKIDNKMIEDVLHKANALEFIQKMPRGLDTVVGERGSMLSGGQRQRIAIARALLKNPKLLILDEATSALDAESEFLVQKALEDLMKNRTVITIAHRLSTVKKADVIIVLENGKVIEKGKYDDLIFNRGAFYRLVQHQNLKS